MQGLIPTSKTFFKKNGSTILTCFGAAGVIATAISAAKATPKALLLLEEAEKEKKTATEPEMEQKAASGCSCLYSYDGNCGDNHRLYIWGEHHKQQETKASRSGIFFTRCDL